MKFDAGGAMRLGEEMRGRHRDDAAHDPVGQLDDPDRLAAGARHRGEFEADKSGADHDDPFGRVEPLAQRVGLGQRAQIAHPVEIDAGQRRHPVARAGREHEMGVAETLAAFELHGFGRRGRSPRPWFRPGTRYGGRDRTLPAASAADRGRSCRRDNPSTAADAGRAVPVRRRSAQPNRRTRLVAARRPAESRHGWRRR